MGTVRGSWTFTLASWDPADLSEAVPVLPGGRFKHAEAGGVVRGRFIRQGRVAVGRIVWPRGFCRLAPDVAGRDRVTVRFRARLTGRPNAARPGKPSNCDRVSVRYSRRKAADDAYQPVEQGLGCTSARRLARAWDASAECASLPGPGAQCRVSDAVCERTIGGIWRPRASVRCSMPDQPSKAAEFVYHEACREPPHDRDGDFTLWAINLDCATARSFPINEFIDAPNAPCGSNSGRPPPDWCTSVAGYSCAARAWEGTVIGYSALCIVDADPFRALRLDYNFGI
jgi:hypothetical protein